MTESNSNRLIWLDDKLVPLEKAKISILSPTCMYGLNVFESLRAYFVENRNLALFRVADHIERLFQSCRILGLPCPRSRDDILDTIRQTVVACRFDGDVSIRVVLYMDNQESWASTDISKLMIAPIKKGRAFERPITCCVSSWERISDNAVPPRAKVGANYVSGRLAQLDAKRHGYDMPLLLNARGTVAEAPGACLFMVRDGNLVTPPTCSSILESITRASLLDLAKDLDIGVEIREIDRTELYCATEAFVCGTAVEITPIKQIDHCDIPTGPDAPVTEKLMSLYFSVVRGKVELRSNWITLI